MIERHADRFGRISDIRCVGLAPVAGRRADRDKNKLRVFQADRVVGRKRKSLRSGVAAHQLFETRLVNGQNAGAKPVDLAYINIDADYVVAQIGETGSSDKSNISGPDDRDVAHASTTVGAPGNVAEQAGIVIFRTSTV